MRSLIAALITTRQAIACKQRQMDHVARDRKSRLRFVEHPVSGRRKNIGKFAVVLMSRLTESAIE
jgi:hypothetical protein